MQYNKGLELAKVAAAPNAADDTNLSNGRYAAMIVAYKLVENERAIVPNGPGLPREEERADGKEECKGRLNAHKRTE